MNAKTADTADKDQTFAGLTAEQWREKAHSSRKASYDSFERSDTDGFLSQWAHDTMAGRYEHCARVAENGGVATAPALFKDGEMVVNARNVKGRFGYAWVYDDENGVAHWLNESQAQKAEKRRQTFVNKYEGYTVGWAVFPVGLDSRTGETFCRYSEPVEVVSTDDTDFTENHNNAY